jgi:hypothetical protein
MLEFLKELFHPPPKTFPIRIGSSSPVFVPESWFLIHPFPPPETNIVEAQREGLQPLNFKQIFKQIPAGELQNTILFDSTPTDPGNHWRVIEIRPGSNNRDYVTLQLTSGFGVDEKDFPPVTVSQYDILYNGINIIHYGKKQKTGEINPINLEELNNRIDQVNANAKNFTYPEDITSPQETILFTDKDGNLLSTDNHPAFHGRG